ncbi:rRNA biogenesis protein rrp5 [Vermiconidia calcicola]|uniref:rRNA biogenesis protein rrp5 n=1 Tax=Vermiconidia calcicola TaxID=1690605 RepID=A0ACC3N897_9PEZI|nr:rRNA biogenesis protein rrp5 [Vermiconidia calcicola]
MASVKRKAVTDERPSKKVKSAKEDPQQKPAKSAKTAKPQTEDSSERRAIPKSVLQQEDRAFPRGGASVLTPIEHKQIKAQAEHDVLYEQQTGRDATHGDGELFDGDTASTPARRKKKAQRTGADDSKKVESAGVKIEGLSYKTLSVGSVVLGYVTAISGKDVTLAMANNLSEFVPITAVSERLNGRIEKLLDNEGQDAGADEDEDVDLKRLFYVGQWLRATVTATVSDSADSAGKSKRHIELSVDPRSVNGGLDSDGVVQNSMVQAAVRSVEDHGLIMDVGLSDSSVKGFISKKELGAAYKLEDVQEGQVMLCLVTGKGSNGKVLKLSPDAAPFSAPSGNKQPASVTEAPTVEGFQPGTAVDVLVTESGARGVIGKVMGMLDVTADVVHSGSGTGREDPSNRYKVGSKVRARIIWTTPQDDGSRRIGISLLDHLLTLPPPPAKLPENAHPKLKAQATELERHHPLSSIVESAKVRHVLADRGLFIDLPGSGSGKSANAFAHISQISDKRIDTITSSTGSYKLESTHRARIIAYNSLDNLYYVSLKPSILEQTFLRIEDLPVGATVKGNVERLILGAKGITGILVKLSDSITGLVPEMHLSDVQLQHPERKYKEGFPVKAKVLSVDLEKRHVRLTLKKTLVNEEDLSPIWKDYADLRPGMESKGTIINMLPNGAVVQFYGSVRAWLPVAEMSDTFIEVPEKHFRLGQTVNARIVSVDADAHEMKVSCKDSTTFTSEQQEAWNEVVGGQLVSGTVTEKSTESVTVELDSGLKGLIRAAHLTDGGADKIESSLTKIHVGRKLSDLVVLHKLERSRHLLLTRKPSMVEDAKTGSLIRTYAGVRVGRKVNGFVRNVTPEGVYTEFAKGVVGLLPKSQLSPEMMGQPAFGLTKDQSIGTWVLSADAARERFSLSMREQTQAATAQQSTAIVGITISNPADPSLSSVADLTLGKVTKARIASTKATQINVRLADNVQGRIDVSEVFDTWDDITNKKAPLQKFKPNEVLEVKILGIHDARNHRFLPISHRQSSVPVFELSAKKSRIDEANESGLTMDSVKAGSSHVAFVNNHGDNCVWVNLSPNVRGRVALMDLSDDAGQLHKLDKNFPIGCALRVSVKSVNAAMNRLDLSAKTGAANEELTLQTISPGMVLTGRVTKITERSVAVQLADNLAASVPLVEIGDDFDQLNLSQYNKNDIVRVCVVDVDLPNKKLFLTLRPSKVLSSSLPVKDTQVTSYAQLKAGDIVRGFVKHVGEKGVHVSLGARIEAFIKISDLSDKYVKDWKSVVEMDQLVKGRVLSVDAAAKHIHLSIKASHVDADYEPPITIHDLKPGTVVTGQVRKVEDFGAFIDIDNTQPRLSGLCHRSEVAAKRVEDVRTLYSAGDVVKAKVLNVDVEARKISLGLKASYFSKDAIDEDMDDDEDDSVDEADGGATRINGDDDDGGVDLDDERGVQSDAEDSSEADAMDVEDDSQQPTSSLKPIGFDWTGDSLAPAADDAASESDGETPAPKKRKRHRAEIKFDLTGDLDKYGSRSVSDFERQLLGQPNDSGLWVQYMAFQLQLGEMQKAREIAERALRTIHIREVEDKANVWIAWMNLEVEYGDDDHVEDVFKRACQVQDPLEMHEKLASIYIDSGKHEKADAIFERIVGNKAFRARPEVWLNYANFLMDTLKAPARARSLLSRALQSIPTNEHRLLTAKFAALEFRSTQGDAERGRTIFEGLVSEWPKWSSGWDMFVDLERARLAHAKNQEAQAEAKEKVRALYDRIVAQKMKKRRAKFIFKRWLEFEEAEGNEKSVERVKALAKAYVEAQQAQRMDDMEE